MMIYFEWLGAFSVAAFVVSVALWLAIDWSLSRACAGISLANLVVAFIGWRFTK